MNALAPITNETLTDIVERKLYEYIGKNRLSPGNAMPKEQDLADSLNVSRHIVREALSRLRMLGIIESRRKRGLTISTPDPFMGLERMVSMNVLDLKSQVQLCELRVILEVGMADFIFKRKTDADIKDLEEIIKSDGPEKYTLSYTDDIEYKFHSRLYMISGNDVLKRLQGILKPFFQIVAFRDQEIRKNKKIPTHRELCNILKNGTNVDFQNAMRKHLEVYLP